jgi:hypothetical protein
MHTTPKLHVIGFTAVVMLSGVERRTRKSTVAACCRDWFPEKIGLVSKAPHLVEGEAATSAC